MKTFMTSCFERREENGVDSADSKLHSQVSEEGKSCLNYDQYLSRLNNFGRFQKFQWFLLFLSVLPQAWYSYVPVFSAMKVEEEHVSCANTNATMDVCRNINGTSCTQRIYDTTFTSIVTDYDMLCDTKLKLAMTKSVFYIGKLIGAYLFGWMSDRYGRILPFFLSAGVQFVASLATTFVGNYYAFTSLRFVLGVCSGGNFLVAFVLATEMVGPGYRNLANAVMQSGYGISAGLQGLIAYLLPNWKHHNLAITLPNILLISYYWILPESSRWQLAKGRREQAATTLQKLAKSNGREFSHEQWALVRQSENVKEKKKYNLRHLFKTRYLTKVTLIEAYSWIVCVFVFYGLGFNSSNLSGNPYINFSATGLIEIPAYIVAAAAVNLVGRRIPGCVYFGIGGLSLLLVVPINLTGNTEAWSGVVLALSLIGKFMAAAAFYQVYIHTAELYPTVVRNLGLGVASATGRVGGILAPILTDGAPEYLPPLVFGITSLIAGLLRLLLPETKGKALPEAFEDEIGKKKEVDEEMQPTLNEKI